MSLLFHRELAVSVMPPGQAGVRITGSRVSFTVEKSSARAPNSLEIKIYNLNDTTTAALLRRDYTLILEAGYKDAVEVLYVGDILTATDAWEAPERITTLSCGDGSKAIRSSTINASFRGGVTAEQIFARLAQSMGLPLGDVRGLGDAGYSSGYSMSGSTASALDRLARRLGVTWSVQDGHLVVRPLGEASPGATVLLSASTGLLGSPERTETGVRVRSLLQPGLSPGRKIRVDSRLLDGDFVVEKVTHTGDTHGDDWSSEAEAREVRR